MLMIDSNLFIYLFLFSSNADLADGLVLGKPIDSWLLYSLIFLGFTAICFLWVWGIGFYRDKREGKLTKQPWE